MEPLVVEYVLEGHRRGYNFTSPTRGIDDASLKTIWRHAIPRGQGWGADVYRGARSLKAFTLENGQVGLSEITVTEQQDEHGRRGIRRAVIHVASAPECLEHLQARLNAYPDEIQARIEKKPTLGQWKKLVDESLPKLRRDAQVVLARPYTSAQDWQIVEAFMLKVVTVRALPMKRWGKVIPFTTLALDYRDESKVVALPDQHVHESDEISVLHIRA
jgi:hypothetical protein